MFPVFSPIGARFLGAWHILAAVPQQLGHFFWISLLIALLVLYGWLILRP